MTGVWPFFLGSLADSTQSCWKSRGKLALSPTRYLQLNPVCPRLPGLKWSGLSGSPRCLPRLKTFPGPYLRALIQDNFYYLQIIGSVTQLPTWLRFFWKSTGFPGDGGSAKGKPQLNRLTLWRKMSGVEFPNCCGWLVLRVFKLMWIQNQKM